ncbi:FadR/GntR family transcriptional regulator [Nocardiopsis ansamitocini]|uniref:GntR family transcriptional regulator n=1 Tax=Nocardiopsis ansamitocini TaxID=1670832 RepID=A0A9W6PAW1_9ACTN|nr:FCD domain-containing protein [Nocardiopsis ansamitocini]GLU50310.1 GntR family transcriptional regulator [Nocardiopsis ansamitocini]
MPSYRGRGVHGRTVELLGRRILAGTPPEGAVLDLPALGTELGVGLSALREAVKVLTAKGLLDARQKRGTFVRPRSAWNLLDADVLRWQMRSGATARLIRDLGELREVVEPAAVRHAATRRTEADLAVLEEALAAMAATLGDPLEHALADLAFHRALLAASGNELLARMDIALEPGLLERDVLVHSAAPHADPIPSHRAVVDAVRSGNPDAAEIAMLSLLASAAADAEHLTTDPF